MLFAAAAVAAVVNQPRERLERRAARRRLLHDPAAAATNAANATAKAAAANAQRSIAVERHARRRRVAPRRGRRRALVVLELLRASRRRATVNHRSLWLREGGIHIFAGRGVTSILRSVSCEISTSCATAAASIESESMGARAAGDGAAGGTPDCAASPSTRSERPESLARHHLC